MKNNRTTRSIIAVGWVSLCAIGFCDEPVELASPPAYVRELQPVQLSFGELPPAPQGEESIDRYPGFSEPELIDPFAERVEYDPGVREPDTEFHWRLSEGLFDALSAPADSISGLFSRLISEEQFAPRSPLEHYSIGLQAIPDRPPLAIEWGEKFLAPGFLSQGIETRSGAVWRPALWVWGEMRTGYNYIDVRNTPTIDELTSRLDLFAQLNLTGTERVLLGVRPLDQEQGGARSFTSYDFENNRGIDGENFDVQTLFFEGDFGEIFPNLDPYDTKALDYGFSIGRQPMLFQQGLLINEDMIDAVTVTRNTLYGGGILNLRMTGVYGWNRIHRNNNVPDNDAQLVGLFTESDYRWATVNADVAFVSSGSATLRDCLAFGLGAIRRVEGYHNVYNSSAQILGSLATEGETAASGDGILLFHQLSWTPHHSDDLIYLNTFWAIDQFTSPARGTLMGGPLGQVGILYSAAGLGRYGAALSNQASSAAGASLGYQFFFDETRQQVIWELGGRSDTNGIDRAAIATALQYQRAIGQHWIFLVNGFVSKREEQGVIPGGRLEVLFRF